MPNKRIYADFNGLQKSSRTADKVELHLHRLGSLIDLSRLKLCLYQGLELDVYSDSDEQQDLEASGIVYFDQNVKLWFVEFSHEDVRHVPRQAEPVGTKFPCWNCGADLDEQIKAHGLDYGDTCEQCGKEIHEPLKAP